MVGRHHKLRGHEFEQTLGDGEGQRSLACRGPWGHKEWQHDLATEQQQAWVRMHLAGKGLQKIPCRRKRQPTPVYLPGKSMDRGAWWATVHGVAKESDAT